MTESVTAVNDRTVNESITEVVLSYKDNEWLVNAACADWPIEEFFVEAGRAINQEALELCRRCPVRIECLNHAYERGLTAGYFGGISPGQRRQLNLVGALELIAAEQDHDVDDT